MKPYTILNLDKPRQLRFGMGAMIELEEITGITIVDLRKGMTPKQCSQILWVILKQDEPELTLEDTVKLIDEYATDLTSIIETVMNTLTLAFEQDDKKRKKLIEQNPNA